MEFTTVILLIVIVILGSCAGILIGGELCLFYFLDIKR